MGHESTLNPVEIEFEYRVICDHGTTMTTTDDFETARRAAVATQAASISDCNPRVQRRPVVEWEDCDG